MVFRLDPDAATAGAPRAVEARAKNGDDSENVLGKLRVGGGRQVTCLHVDRGAVLTEYVLEQIECEAAKAVSVGNAHVS